MGVTTKTITKKVVTEVPVIQHVLEVSQEEFVERAKPMLAYMVAEALKAADDRRGAEMLRDHRNIVDIFISTDELDGEVRILIERKADEPLVPRMTEDD